MPTPQPPVLLYDNVFNRIRQYPAAVLSTSGSVLGTDVRYLTRFCRGQQLWRADAARAGNYVATNLGAGATRQVDSLWLDRGHNLWGKTVRITATDGAGANAWTLDFTVPAAAVRDRWGRYTNAGDPTSTVLCVTEEGALYAFFALQAARQQFQLSIVENFQPVLTGVILGQRRQLPNFSAVMDEDAGAITGERTEVSDTGRVASSTAYQHRELQLVYKRIGVSTYDTIAREIREAVWARRAPTFIAPNYGRNAERGWLYRCSMPRWSAATEGVARPLTLDFTEWQAAL